MEGRIELLEQTNATLQDTIEKNNHIHQKQIEQLQRELNAKTNECEVYQTRLEIMKGKQDELMSKLTKIADLNESINSILLSQ